MLDGVKILDVSRLLPGPAATWFLSGMGAQVDRVETPKGDLTRHLPPYIQGSGAYFAATSWGKRSLCLDFYHPKACTLLTQLLAQYDILVEGFKPGVLEQIGLSPSRLHELYPSLIIARLSGYGQDGTLRDRVGHDINYIAEVGILAAQSRGEHGYAIPSTQIADMGGALCAALNIAAALYERTNTGLGRVLDISLTEAALSLYAPMLTGLMAEGRSAEPGGELLTGGATIYGTYRCADGKWLAVGAVEPKFQAKIRALAGTLNRESLRTLFQSKNREYWLDILGDACVSPVLEAPEVQKSPWIHSRNLIQEGEIRPPNGRFGQTIPQLGENSIQILKEGGFSSTAIDAFLAEGLISIPSK
ncbi:MAG: CaiB/BaiF CoA-transferase family protein [Myxococcota bacterium]|nr:CaiB/BaiF CoA-transferase family protein [Myxococcota bacterium]